MTKEEKQLLFKDLCARQFYNTKVLGPWEKDGPCELSAIDLTSDRQVRVFEDWYKIEEVRPYLRPMSSMTEEEKKELTKLRWTTNDGEPRMYEYCDYCNAHHFDYRGLIGKGLALESPEGMYKSD
jgi:hypothetical protein